MLTLENQWVYLAYSQEHENMVMGSNVGDLKAATLEGLLPAQMMAPL